MSGWVASVAGMVGGDVTGGWVSGTVMTGGGATVA